MIKLHSALYFLLASFIFTTAHAENHHADEPNFKVTALKTGFSFLQGAGGNILLSEGQDGLLIVDSDYSKMTPALEKTLGQFKGDLKFVLNTHWHGDHTQGNLALGKRAHIIAHDNVYARLNSRQEVKLFNMVSEPYPAHALPTLTFDQSLTLHFNGETIEALHFPNGHTDGDSIIFFKQANIVHMGDHYFNGMFPFVDVGSNGSVRGVVANIDKVLSKIDDNTTVIPGHGPISNKAELIKHRDMMAGTADEVQNHMASGMSLEQIQAKGLSDQWKPWGNGFLPEKVWINIVFSSLEKEK